METDQLEPKGEVKSFSSPRLSAEDKLYVRAYLSTLSHRKAHEIACPDLKVHQTNNPFSKKEAVRFHISLGLQERAEALALTPEIILEKLFKEAVREGPGSNHAARIQALTQLGKHLGLFEEKKDNNSHTFNIINYSSAPLSLEEIKEEKIIESELEEPELLESPITFNITSYTDD